MKKTKPILGFFAVTVTTFILPVLSYSSLRISPEAALSFPHVLQVGACLDFPNPEAQGPGAPSVESTQEVPWFVSGFALQNFRFFIDGGYFKLASSPNDFIELFDVQMGTRFYPLNRWSFLSQAVGYRVLNLSRDISTFKIASNSPATSGELNLKTLFYFPAIGLSWEVSESITLETELGVQVALTADGLLNLKNAATGQDSTNTPDLATDSKVAMSRIASLIVPELTLIRLIYHF